MNLDEIKIIVGQWAAENALVRKVYIFGSRARDDFRADSDLDIAIQVNQAPQDGSEYSTWFYFSQELKESLQLLLPYTLQLEWYDPIGTPTVHLGILESSILVYEQQNP